MKSLYIPEQKSQDLLNMYSNWPNIILCFRFTWLQRQGRKYSWHQRRSPISVQNQSTYIIWISSDGTHTWPKSMEEKIQTRKRSLLNPTIWWHWFRSPPKATQAHLLLIKKSLWISVVETQSMTMMIYISKLQILS